MTFPLNNNCQGSLCSNIIQSFENEPRQIDMHKTIDAVSELIKIVGLYPGDAEEITQCVHYLARQQSSVVDNSAQDKLIEKFVIELVTAQKRFYPHLSGESLVPKNLNHALQMSCNNQALPELQLVLPRIRSVLENIPFMVNKWQSWLKVFRRHYAQNLNFKYKYELKNHEDFHRKYFSKRGLPAEVLKEHTKHLRSWNIAVSALNVHEGVFEANCLALLNRLHSAEDTPYFQQIFMHIGLFFKYYKITSVYLNHLTKIVFTIYSVSNLPIVMGVFMSSETRLNIAVLDKLISSCSNSFVNNVCRLIVNIANSKSFKKQEEDHKDYFRYLQDAFQQLVNFTNASELNPEIKDNIKKLKMTQFLKQLSGLWFEVFDCQYLRMCSEVNTLFESFIGSEVKPLKELFSCISPEEMLVLKCEKTSQEVVLKKLNVLVRLNTFFSKRESFYLFLKHKISAIFNSHSVEFKKTVLRSIKEEKILKRIMAMTDFSAVAFPHEELEQCFMDVNTQPNLINTDLKNGASAFCASNWGTEIDEIESTAPFFPKSPFWYTYALFQLSENEENFEKYQNFDHRKQLCFPIADNYMLRGFKFTTNLPKNVDVFFLKSTVKNGNQTLKGFFVWAMYKARICFYRNFHEKHTNSLHFSGLINSVMSNIKADFFKMLYEIDLERNVFYMNIDENTNFKYQSKVSHLSGKVVIKNLNTPEFKLTLFCSDIADFSI